MPRGPPGRPPTGRLSSAKKKRRRPSNGRSANLLPLHTSPPSHHDHQARTADEKRAEQHPFILPGTCCEGRNACVLAARKKKVGLVAAAIGIFRGKLRRCLPIPRRAAPAPQAFLSAEQNLGEGKRRERGEGHSRQRAAAGCGSASKSALERNLETRLPASTRTSTPQLHWEATAEEQRTASSSTVITRSEAETA